MNNTDIKIERNLTFRAVADELRATPLYHFINDDTKSAEIDLRQKDYALTAFVTVNKTINFGLKN